MTEFTILDVGHGSCCYLIAENSNLMVFDCGHKTNPENRPSDILESLGQRSVELLVITNYDEDHISDLENMRVKLNIKQLCRNNTIDDTQLRQLKFTQSGRISSAMESMLEIIRDYNQGPLSPAPEFPDARWYHYHNSYPFANSNDTNNLSVVTILDVHEHTFLIPGDMERDGWITLLNSEQELRERLSDVTVYIASHHGRRNGYCEEIFTTYNCRPDVFVFSDDSIEFNTQNTNHLYSQWARGVDFNNENRKVITTRDDGTITWRWD